MKNRRKFTARQRVQIVLEGHRAGVRSGMPARRLPPPPHPVSVP